jgi:dolichyl-phosphate-mannose--protein O-mannosyl transferase
MQCNACSSNTAPFVQFVWLRAAAALFGAATAPLFYWIIRGWGCSIRAGIFAAWLFMFDNLNVRLPLK